LIVSMIVSVPPRKPYQCHYSAVEYIPAPGPSRVPRVRRALPSSLRTAAASCGTVRTVPDYQHSTSAA